jgi:cardiolipin synthase
MNLANLVSISRLVILPFFVMAVIYDRPGVALTLLILAGLTDLLDGIIARALNQTTTFGEYLDPAIDKLLVAAGVVVLTLAGKPNAFPAWLTTLVLTRDVLIAVVAVSMYLGTGRYRFPPTPLGRVHSTVVVISVGLFLLHNTLDSTTLLIPLAVWITLATTVSSGIHYAYLMTLPAPEDETDAPPDVGTPAE